MAYRIGDEVDPHHHIPASLPYSPDLTDSAVIKAYEQGRADHDFRDDYTPIRAGDYWRAYNQGWNDAAEYASEASLRYAESGAAYEDYLDAKSQDGYTLREEEYARFLDMLRDESSGGEYNPEAGYETSVFMARVLALGEEAQRESDRAWVAGAAERRQRMLRDAKARRDAIPF